MSNEKEKSILDIYGEAGSSHLSRSVMLFAAASEGRIAFIEDYFLQHQGCEHCKEDKEGLIAKLVLAPEMLSQKSRLFNVVAGKEFDFHTFFSKRPTMTLGTIMGMHKIEPTPEIKQIAAVLASEYLRLRILNKMDYQIDATNILLHAGRGESTLTAATGRASARDAVIAVQNALVDYIQEEGPGLPLNRGAAVLFYLTRDPADVGHQGTLNFLTRKITDLHEGTRYHSQMGDIKHVRPVFGG